MASAARGWRITLKWGALIALVEVRPVGLPAVWNQAVPASSWIYFIPRL